MFGLSFAEILVAMVVSFLVFGPEQFPVMLKKAIQQIGELKRYLRQAQNSIHDFTRDIEKDFNPNQWTASDSSVAQNPNDPSHDTPILSKLSTNPDDYEMVSLKEWRWQSHPQGKPENFEPQPFNWKEKSN